MRRSKKARVGKAWWGALALGAVGAAALAAYLLQRPNGTAEELDVLGRRIETLEARAEALAQARAALTAPARQELLPNYQIECVPPWRELGPIGQGLWGCQVPEPLPNGFYPNCNLTSSRVQVDLTAQGYYEAASRSPQLIGARQLGARAIRLRHQAAYEGIFEHELGGAPLRVLATIVVREGRAFAITCSAPGPSFDTFVAHFRAIAASFDLGV